MNELWIYDVIGEGFFEAGVTDKAVRDELKSFKDGEPISVRINSPGGSVHHAVAIKTLLDQWRGPINVQIDGLAASAASFIAMAGDTIAIAEGSLLMIHNPWSVGAGDAKAMRKEADILDKVGEGLNKAYAGKTGIDAKEIARMMDEETWLTADEAVELGFADSKIEEHKAAAFVVPAAMGFKNVPKEAGVAEPKQRPAGKIAALRRRLELSV